MTDGRDFHIDSICLSPDGEYAALFAPPTSDVNDFDKAKVLLFRIADSTTRELPVKYPRGISFSRDSKRLACIVPSDDDPWFDNGVIEIIDLSDLSKKRIDNTLDLSFEMVEWTDRGLFVSWIEDSTISLGIFNKNGEFERLTSRDEFVQAFSFTPGGEHIAIVRATDVESPELYLDGKRISNV